MKLCLLACNPIFDDCIKLYNCTDQDFNIAFEDFDYFNTIYKKDEEQKKDNNRWYLNWVYWDKKEVPFRIHVRANTKEKYRAAEKLMKSRFEPIRNISSKRKWWKKLEFTMPDCERFQAEVKVCTFVREKLWADWCSATYVWTRRIWNPFCANDCRLWELTICEDIEPWPHTSTVPYSSENNDREEDIIEQRCDAIDQNSSSFEFFSAWKAIEYAWASCCTPIFIVRFPVWQTYQWPLTIWVLNNEWWAEAIKYEPENWVILPWTYIFNPFTDEYTVTSPAWTFDIYWDIDAKFSDVPKICPAKVRETSWSFGNRNNFIAFEFPWGFGSDVTLEIWCYNTFC